MWTKEGDLRSPKKRCRVDQTHQAQRKRSENDNSEVERIVAAKEDDTNRDFHKQLRSISSDDVDSVFHGPLPPEILLRILGYCRAPELLRTERTCKRLMGLLRTSTPDTEEIWKCVVCSYWPWANEITFDESSKSRPPAWRRVFQYLRGLHFSTFAPLENCHINFLPALRTPFMRTTRQNWYTRRSPFSKPSFLSGPAQFPLAIIEECEEEQVLAVIPGVEGNVDLLELSSVSVLVSRMASSTCASSTCGLPPVMDFGFRHIEIDFELCLPEWQAVLVGVVGYDTSTPERSLLLEKGNAWFFDIGELTVPEFYNNDCRCGIGRDEWEYTDTVYTCLTEDECLSMEAQKMRIVIDRNQAKLHLYTLKGASEIKRKIGEIQNYDMWKVNLNDLCLFFDFGAVNKAEQLTFLAEKSFARVLKVKPSNQAWCEMTDEL